MQNPNQASPKTSQDFEPEKTKKKKRHTNPRNRTRGDNPQARYQEPTKVPLNNGRTNFKKKRSPNLQRQKSSRTREHSANGQRTFLRKLEATTEISTKIESHHYHKMLDDDKALMKPSLSSHVGVTPDPRNGTALAYACFS